MNDSLRIADFEGAMVRARSEYQKSQLVGQPVGVVPVIEAGPKAVLKAAISLITTSIRHGDSYSLLEALVLLEELDDAFEEVAHSEWKRKARRL